MKLLSKREYFAITKTIKFNYTNRSTFQCGVEVSRKRIVICSECPFEDKCSGMGSSEMDAFLQKEKMKHLIAEILK